MDRAVQFVATKSEIICGNGIEVFASNKSDAFVCFVVSLGKMNRS